VPASRPRQQRLPPFQPRESRARSQQAPSPPPLHSRKSQQQQHASTRVSAVTRTPPRSRPLLPAPESSGAAAADITHGTLEAKFWQLQESFAAMSTQQPSAQSKTALPSPKYDAAPPSGLMTAPRTPVSAPHTQAYVNDDHSHSQHHRQSPAHHHLQQQSQDHAPPQAQPIMPPTAPPPPPHARGHWQWVEQPQSQPQSQSQPQYQYQSVSQTPQQPHGHASMASIAQHRPYPHSQAHVHPYNNTSMQSPPGYIPASVPSSSPNHTIPHTPVSSVPASLSCSYTALIPARYHALAMTHTQHQHQHQQLQYTAQHQAQPPTHAQATFATLSTAQRLAALMSPSRRPPGSANAALAHDALISGAAADGEATVFTNNAVEPVASAPGVPVPCATSSAALAHGTGINTAEKHHGSSQPGAGFASSGVVASAGAGTGAGAGAGIGAGIGAGTVTEDSLFAWTQSDISTMFPVPVSVSVPVPTSVQGPQTNISNALSQSIAPHAPQSGAGASADAVWDHQELQRERERARARRAALRSRVDAFVKG
jgi:hypothetical protein